MRFARHKVTVQMRLMLEHLVREGLIEIPIQATSKLREGLERIVERYIEQFEQLEDDTLIFLGKHQLDKEKYYKRVFQNLAEERKLPISDDVFDHLNAQIQEYLWNAEAVEEIFADERQLVAMVTPFLKAMLV